MIKLQNVDFVGESEPMHSELANALYGMPVIIQLEEILRENQLS